MRAGRGVVAVLLALCVLTGCERGSPSPPDRPDTIRFASYDFPENQTLVEVYAEAVRRRGLPVSVQHGIGTREVVSPALQQGVVDVVVDYLGTALAFARPQFPRPPEMPEQMHAVLTRTMGGRGVDVLAAADAEDQNGFAVTTDFAAAHDVHRLSDLTGLAGDLAFGGPPECPDRPFCLLGLEQVYGVRFGAVTSMPSRAATIEALLAGQIQVGMLETTDARLAIAPVVLLADDRGLQPRENVVPMVRSEVFDRWGEPLREALESTSARLTTADLVALNRAVELQGRTPAEAARAWWDRQ
ncbi:ABC transporter substrate-binding protein [Blastococcus saxobsidens]|uniref:Putative glycine betaine/choline-binding (Lipo) protein of an ABC-type transport system (Osmoprotectant binding protein) n=1 Tax=Blastococcus saxobsidens (strain DD2) TaxID=1146883 RepID=H6RQM5_BLASD|nr:ABC transporter substrate-binding protein [Blastococcus saxobsidens]CCG05393.1 putative glycine betaine/choline-binding (Lipo) protein of an ABC-type transport system (Osmoprotectant binding protein) [Blastococcus saxobsidens DD2]